MESAAEGQRPSGDSSEADRLKLILGKPIRRLQQHLSLEFEHNPFRDLSIRVMVASSGGRVGSHVLLQGLLRHGLKVNEYFNPKPIINVSTRRWFSNIGEYCDYRLEQSSSERSFGVKGGPHILIPMLMAGELPQYFGEWSIIYLNRTDIVRQAVSQFKAELTGSWRSAQAPSRQASDDDYNGQQIAKIVETILSTERTWEDVFVGSELDPLRLAYEELATSPEEAIARVASFAHLKGEPIELTSDPVQVQADTLNERWRERFIEDHPDFDFSRGSPRQMNLA